jgi:primosomal protein N' (replication factor Y)
VIVSGAEAAETERMARQLARIAPVAEDVDRLGPAPAPLAVIKGRHRWRLLVRTGRKVNIQAFVRRWLEDLKPAGSLRVDVDIDPYQFL